MERYPQNRFKTVMQVQVQGQVVEEEKEKWKSFNQSQKFGNSENGIQIKFEVFQYLLQTEQNLSHF